MITPVGTKNAYDADYLGLIAIMGDFIELPRPVVGAELSEQIAKQFHTDVNYNKIG